MASITTRVVRNARRRGVKVYTRKQWYCINLAVYQWRRRFRKHKPAPSDTLWQHISVTNRDDSDKTTLAIKTDMRELHAIGMSRFGSGVSYNFGIDMVTGEVGLGQSLDAKGTHTLNDKNIPNYSYDQNYVSLAFCFIGMPGMKPSAKAIVAAGKLMAACIDEGALTSHLDYNPHSMVAYKECPTDAVREAMPMILKVSRQELD